MFTARHLNKPWNSSKTKKELPARPQSSDWMAALTEGHLFKIKPSYQVLAVILCYQGLLVFVTRSQLQVQNYGEAIQPSIREEIKSLKY